MMKKILDSIKKDWFILALIAVTFIVSIYFYPSLPSKVPNHWNVKGQIDGYSGRFWGAFEIPFMNAAFYFLFIFLPYLDPKKANYAKFSSAYKLIRYALHIFLTGLQVIILLAALGYSVNTGMFVGIGTSLLFVVIGNVMGKFKHNYFVGIKNPWTLANEEVWIRTHRMAAPFWVIGGIVSAVFAVIGGEIAFIALMVIILVITIVPTVYSYIIFKKLDK